jgi:hypothetical protein
MSQNREGGNAVKKRSCRILAVVLMLAVLCGCGGKAVQKTGALYAGETEPEQQVVSFQDMVYIRPDLSELEQTLAWIATGLPFDILHCGGNLAAGLLILPLSELLRRLDAGSYRG